MSAIRLSIPQLFLLAGASIATANATCSFSSPTLTCTGGAGASVTVGPSFVNVAGSPYPANLVVNNAPAGATITAVRITLHGVTADGNNGHTLAAAGFLLASPSNRYLEVLHATGDQNALDTFSNNTVNLMDGNPSAPDINTAINGTGATFNWKPSSFGDPNNRSVAGTYPSSAPPNGHPAALSTPQPLGSATFASVFTGDAPNGTWKLYLVADGASDVVSFTSWDIVFTVSVSNVSTTTVLTTGTNPSFTAGTNHTTVLTATVTGTGGPTGSVTFSEGGNLTCSEGLQPRPLNGSSVATCTTSFATEGFHLLVATYNPTGSFVTSNSSLNQWVKNHSSFSGGQYCNAGAISVPGLANTSPYPSVINVGTDTPSISNSLSTLSLVLKNISTSDSGGLFQSHMLLVGPGGSRALVFLSSAGGTFALPTSTFTFSDTAPTQVPFGFPAPPPGGAVSYQPTSYNTSETFPQPNAPAPQVPASFRMAAPAGNPNSKTFTSEFGGASANGDWTLYIYNNGNTNVPVAGGWCLAFTEASGAATTTTVSGSPNRSATGSPVTVTAHVQFTSGGAAVSGGTVTFTENGQPVAGGPSSPVTVSGGDASFVTSSLTEGDHTILATYNGIPANAAISFNSYVQRVDNATQAPVVTGTTYSFCNAGAITIPGPNNASNIGQAGPNPSNVFISNLPGTINAARVDLLGAHIRQSQLTSFLLVGPAATNAATLSFFSHAGNGASTTTGNFRFEDSAAAVAGTGAITQGIYEPTSYTTSDTFFASTSGFYTLPAGPYQYGGPSGNFTFNTTGSGKTGVYQNGNGNGTWSLYINQNTHDDGSGIDNGWCVGLTQNLPDIQLSPLTDSANFKQGQPGSYTVTVHNNGPGATGNAPSTNAPQVTFTRDANLTYAAGSGGTNWTCPASPPAGTVMTCTFGGTVGAGNDLPALTINVNVGIDAPLTVTSSAVFAGGGDGTSGNNSSSLNSNVIQVAKLSVSKVHNGTAFTTLQNGSYSIVVHNSGSVPTDATVTMEDFLPGALQFVSASGTGWNCTNSFGDVVCTSTTPIAANSDAGVITLTANAGTSQISVSNTATISGGGGVIVTAQSTDTVTVLQPSSVSNITSSTAAGTYGTGTVIPLTVLFTRATTVTGTPLLTLNSGGTAIYSPGESGSGTLVFNYTVGAGQSTADLDVTAIPLNGGTISDPNGNPAILTGVAGHLSTNSNIAIDTAAPTVVSYSVVFGTTGVYNTIGSPRNRLPWQITGIRVVFSRAITTGNVNSLSGVTATGISGVGTTTVTWTINPAALGTFNTALAASGANGLKDSAGNFLSNGTAFSKTLKVLWGDMNDDGTVNATDVTQVNNARAGAYNLFADMNGDGVVDTADVTVVRSRLNTSLP